MLYLTRDSPLLWKMSLLLYVSTYALRISYATVCMASLRDQYQDVRANLQLVPTSCYGKEVRAHSETPTPPRGAKSDLL